MAAGPEMLGSAEDRLRRRLGSEPQNPRLLRRLADTQRMLGKLAQARDSYRRLLALGPDPTTAWLVDVLGTDPLPTPPSGRRAVPFALLTDFSSAAENDWLLATTLAAPQCFVPAKVSGAHTTTDLDYRLAFVADRPLRKEIRRWFLPKFRVVLPGMLARLASDCRGLRADRLGDYVTEINVTMHQAGGLYQIHEDVTPEGRESNRRLSFVLYFGQRPQRFQGGDLLLHDKSYDEAQEHAQGDDFGDGYTRVAPLPSSLVIFPSDSAHEVTRIVSPTGGPLDFADCRFTVNGWIHASRQS